MANIYETLLNADGLSATDTNNINTNNNNNYDAKVYDGDTTYKDGVGYRALGIDTPEMNTANKVDTLASAKEKKLDRLKPTAGDLAKLEAELNPLNLLSEGTDVGTDKYGRVLNQNEGYKNEMIHSGYAVPTFFSDENDISSVESMNRAKEAKRGLWADPEYAKEMAGIVDKRILNSTGASNEVKNAAGYVTHQGNTTVDDYMNYAKEKDDSNWIDALQAQASRVLSIPEYLVAQSERVFSPETAQDSINRVAYQMENADILAGYNADEASLPNKLGRAIVSGGMNVANKGAGLIGEGIESLGDAFHGIKNLDKEFVAKENARLAKYGEEVSDTRANILDTLQVGEAGDWLKELGKGIQKDTVEFTKKNNSSKLAGFNTKDVNELQTEVMDTIDKEGYMAAFGKAVTDERSLQVLAQSVPEMVALAYSVGGMALVNVNNNINIAEANAERELTANEKVLSATTSIVSTYLDRLGDKLALSGMSPAKEALKTAVDNAPAVVKRELSKKYGQGILKIGEAPLRLTGAASAEGATEYAQTLGEEATQNVDVFKKGFTDEQWKEAQVAGVLGAAMGTHMAIPSVGIDTIGTTARLTSEGVSDLRDKVYTKLGVDIPLGSTAKETGPVEPDQRTNYTKKIVEDTAELYFNPEKSFQAGYTDQSDEILTNAISRIMEVNELPEQTRDIVAGNLAREMYYKLNEAGSDGETRIPREEGVSRLQNMLSKFKGNKYVEAVVAQESRNELNREADNIVLRLENDGINVNNLDEVVKSLSKEELTNLNKALDNMKIMGSEELTNRANTIQNMLENKRAEVLGSEAEDGVPPRKKTVAEVRAEIETLGFLTKNGMKKSLYDHDKDLLATVNNPLASEAERGSVLTSLRTFVNSRTSKLSPININPAEGLIKARTPRELKNFAEINLEDNEKLIKVIEDALKRDHLVDADRAELEGMHAVLRDNQKYLDSIANVELNAPSELKKFYDDLLGDLKSTGAITDMINKDVMDMMENFKPVRNTPKENKSETVPVQAKPMGDLAKYRELSNRQVELVNELEKDGVSSDERTQITKELAAVERAMEELSPKKVAESKEEKSKPEPKKEAPKAEKAAEETTEVKESNISKEEYDAELVRLGEELQTIESEYNTLKEWVDTGKAIKQEHKKAINEAKKAIDESGVKEELADIKAELRALRQTKKTIENTIGYISRLERKHETTLSKYKAAGNTIADMKKELDSINAQIEKQEKALEKNTSKALSGFSGNIINKAKDLISKIIKSLDRLYKQLVVKEAKIEKKEREYDTLAKDIKQLEKDLSRVKDDLGKMESLESINAKIDVLQDKKDAVQEEMDKLRARLDNAKALREKALGDQALAGEALAEVQENAKYLSKQIKAYKDAMTKWFRAPMAKILEGSKAKVSTSQSRGVSHRLLSGYDIMDIMPKIFTRTEEGKETVREAMELFKQFESERSGTVIYQNVKDATDEHVLVKTGLDKLFSMEAMSDPIIKAKLIKAMNVSTAITLGEMVDVKTLSDDQLYDFVKGAFANILPDEPKDRNNAIYDLMNKVRQGEIVPLATFRSNAGKRLLKELEVKLDTDTIGDRDNVENALGALVIENMLGKYDKGNTKRVVNLAKGTVVYDYNTGTVDVKSGNTKEEHKAEEGESLSSVGIMDLSEMTAEEVSEINKIATVLEYAGDKTDGRINLSPVKVEEGSKVRNSDVKKGKDVEKYLNKQGSMAWKFSEDFKSIWEDIAGKDLGKLTEIILGNKEEILTNASPIELESLQAKYEADALDIERMMMAYNLVGTDTEFYIGWDYTVSNRNMMSNKMINPQNSKISRFIISAKGMRHKLTVSEDELVVIEHAIAQAFDLDPDKKDDASVKESLAEFGIRLSIKDGKYKLQIADGAKGAGLRKLIKDDKPVNPERIRNWFGVGTGHLMHAHQAIMLLKAINNTDGEIETNLALEADGITNGMASTALQMGLMDGTKGYYIKSGLYIPGHNEAGGKEIKSHGEFKKAEGLDFYETPIEDFKYYLGKDAEFIETTINGKWRSFLKPLVMVLIYGAGVDNIVMSGSTDLVAKIINDGKNADEVKKVFRDLIKDMKVDHKTEGIRLSSLNNAIERITQKSVKFNPDTGKAELVNDKNGKVYIDQDGLTQLATLMSLKVGEPLKLAFRDSFAPVKTYRSALKTIEAMNYIIFQNEFNNKVKALGKETMSDLSEAELTKIKEELIAEGTYYGANNYFGETQDYFNSEKIKDPNNKVKVALTLPFARYNSSNIGSSRDIAGSLREIASNIGAIGVVDIHSVDGATMIEGHINDVLNIFDALVMGLDPVANKEQMEAINQAYIDINMNHSILGRAVEKLYKNRDKFVGITRLDSAQDIQADLVRAYELSDSGAAAILDQIGNIGKQLDMMHQGRQDLRASDIDVKQYYIADALGGGKWVANTKIPEGSRPFIFSDKGSEAKKERDAIKSMLSKLEDLVINIPVQEALASIKAGDGIMSQQVSKEDAKLIDKLSDNDRC